VAAAVAVDRRRRGREGGGGGEKGRKEWREGGREEGREGEKENKDFGNRQPHGDSHPKDSKQVTKCKKSISIICIDSS